MNKKKSEHKRIYKKGLMNVEERILYNLGKEQEMFVKKWRQNKKLKK